ncbi:Carboxylic ester hydrolase [Sergentomyia squamirostris]
MKWKSDLVIFLLVLIGSFSVRATENDQEDALVNLPNGPLRGEKTPKFFSFKGIPYAEAPIGERRFEPTELYREKWSEVRNATEFGESCMQLVHIPIDDNLRGAEDCLFLNVYTSSLDETKNLPVFFYIHGGAFMFGGSVYYNPERIFDHQELVLVTINYRVGPLGFLSTENEVVPGNMGLKDQVLALQWVKKNIHLFGGDADSVTITGLSAGGASTHLHYFSSLSSGLFHRGHSMSGCALNPWVMMENGKKKATKLATHFSCSTDDPKQMIACLKTKPAEEIVKASKLFMPWLYNPFSPFGVVVEKPGPKAFLTAHPEDLLRAGKVAQVPWIVSLTDAEGLYPVADFVHPASKLEELKNKWTELAPAVLDYAGSVSPKDQKTVAEIVRKFYMKDEEISEKNLDKLVDMFSDRLFVVGISLSARLHFEFAKAPVYLVYYTYPALEGIQHVYAPQYNFKRAGHGDENLVLFKTSLRKLPLTEKEKEMVKVYTNFLVSYATKDTPKFAGITVKPITSKHKMSFLHIKKPDSVSMSETVGFGNEEFWYSLPIAEYTKWNAPKKPQKIEL